MQEELINDYMSKEASTANRAIPLLLIARHLERICDHATNIAEDVIYMVQAKVVKHHPEKLKNGKWFFLVNFSFFQDKISSSKNKFILQSISAYKNNTR